MTEDLNMRMVSCPDCREDKEVLYPRNCDALCLECGGIFCGGHIGPHLEKEHCISLSLNHCKKKKRSHRRSQKRAKKRLLAKKRDEEE